MQFTTALLASAAALTASALPQAAPVEDGKRFGVVAIRSGSPIQNLAIQAAHAHLMIGADSQGAGCDAPTNSATFYLSKEELYLHTGGATPQKIFVDRSGMGKLRWVDIFINVLTTSRPRQYRIHNRRTTPRQELGDQRLGC